MAGATLYVTFKDRSPYATIGSVTDIKQEVVDIYDGTTYRDLWQSTSVPTASGSAGSTGVPMLAIDSTNTASVIVEQPIVPGLAITPITAIGTAVTKEYVYLPDNVLHVEPRVQVARKTYIVFVQDPAVAINGNWGLRIEESLVRCVQTAVPPSGI